MIRGSVQLDLRKLDQLDNQVKARGIALKAVKAGAKLVQATAKANAPRSSGALKQAIGIRAVKGTKTKTGAYCIVGARKKVVKSIVPKGRNKARVVMPAMYAHLVDQGTKPHAIGKAKHPGTKATKFLQNALQSTSDAAAAASLAVFETEIGKVLK